MKYCIVFLGLHALYCRLWCVSRQTQLYSTLCMWFFSWLASLALNPKYFQTADDDVLQGMSFSHSTVSDVWFLFDICLLSVEYLTFNVVLLLQTILRSAHEGSSSGWLLGVHSTQYLFWFVLCWWIMYFCYWFNHIHLVVGSQNCDQD